MNKLMWQAGTAAELAELLKQSTLENSSAVGETTIYHVSHDGREKLALSLGGGHALIVELNQTKFLRRRRLDPIGK